MRLPVPLLLEVGRRYLFAGGIMLARAVKDATLSDRILRAGRRLAVPEAGAGAPEEPRS